jgi:hypothetical protein
MMKGPEEEHAVHRSIGNREPFSSSFDKGQVFERRRSAIFRCLDRVGFGGDDRGARRDKGPGDIAGTATDIDDAKAVKHCHGTNGGDVRPLTEFNSLIRH